jgi:hypothetical protein
MCWHNTASAINHPDFAVCKKQRKLQSSSISAAFVLSAGVGRPALVKILVPTSKAPFPKVLDAVRSNSTAQGGNGSITLILERKDGQSSAAADSSSSSSEMSVVGGVQESEGAGADETAAAFDPKIFE